MVKKNEHSFDDCAHSLIIAICLQCLHLLRSVVMHVAHFVLLITPVHAHFVRLALAMPHAGIGLHFLLISK